MYDLNNPNDIIAQMVKGGMTIGTMRTALNLALVELNDWEPCYSCEQPCSNFSEYQDDGRSFCSLDCLNEADKPDPDCTHPNYHETLDSYVCEDCGLELVHEEDK